MCQIYILLYKEVGIGMMPNASAAAKARFLALGAQKNIYVIRHPNHLSLSSGALCVCQPRTRMCRH